jgi:hypothetical protein
VTGLLQPGGVTMNLYDVSQNSFHHRIGYLLNHILSVLGFIIFWAFMFALLTCPSWLPPLVDKIH